jgi:UDP-2,3-diacylglucosamine pyrophosphatase LpxH
MKKPVLKFRTIIISDVHLGTPDCKVREVNHFLKHTRCEKLILNGDIIDGWQLARGARWTKQHTRFIRNILKRIEKNDTEVIYLRGNHDDVLGRFLPLRFGSLQIAEDYIHETPAGNYLVLHGDIFDSVIKNVVFLAHLGDLGYKLLLRINRIYNRVRAWRGKEYYSLSKAIKARVKSAVSFVSKFEERLTNLARSRGCIGVVCGHIHTPEIRMMNGVHYLNSGDWVESLTAIVEHFDGRFELIDFKSFAAQIPFERKETDFEPFESAPLEEKPTATAAFVG